ncbi:hypothetical protein ACIQUL_18105 [Streptomyces sp. NPDC090303]|uniref:hypothetical protein n=1 Tax=Streptomyces sp. NPDC090303 TaxID=3365960 RepID=UPI0037F832BD
MTNAHGARRHRIPSDDLAELIKEFGLEDVVDRRHLADRLMNVNWQLATPRGTFALKRIMDVPLDSLRRNLAVLPALAEAGIPVIVPVVGSSGGVVVEVGESGYCLFRWAQGVSMNESSRETTAAAAYSDGKGASTASDGAI